MQCLNHITRKFPCVFVLYDKYPWGITNEIFSTQEHFCIHKTIYIYQREYEYVVYEIFYIDTRDTKIQNIVMWLCFLLVINWNNINKLRIKNTENKCHICIPNIPYHLHICIRIGLCIYMLLVEIYFHEHHQLIVYLPMKTEDDKLKCCH